MKRLFILFFMAQSAYGAISLVQSTSTSSTSATVLTKAYTSSLGTASLLVAVSQCFNTFCSSGAVTSTNNTWTKAVNFNFGTEVTIYYDCNSVAGADTVTLTSSGSAFEMELHIYEFSGVAAVTCLDQTGTNFSASGTTFSVTTSGSVSQSTELLFGAVADQNSPPRTPISGTGTWTAQQNTSTTQYALASLTSSTTTGLSGTQTVSVSVASAPSAWSGVIATFKGAAPGSSYGTITPIVISRRKPCEINPMPVKRPMLES